MRHISNMYASLHSHASSASRPILTLIFKKLKCPARAWGIVMIGLRGKVLLAFKFCVEIVKILTETQIFSTCILPYMQFTC